MARPYSTPGLRTLLSAVTGQPIDGNVPKWLKRQRGWVPNEAKAKGGAKKQRK